jgi:hypothetical protein
LSRRVATHRSLLRLMRPVAAYCILLHTIAAYCILLHHIAAYCVLCALSQLIAYYTPYRSLLRLVAPCCAAAAKRPPPLAPGVADGESERAREMGAMGGGGGRREGMEGERDKERPPCLCPCFCLSLSTTTSSSPTGKSILTGKGGGIIRVVS